MSPPRAFMLARCVEPAKYFDFVDLLYTNQEEWAFKDNPLPGLQKFAKQVGFTEDRFNQCIKDEKLLELYRVGPQPRPIRNSASKPRRPSSSTARS